jgi:DHA3 family macrolide efflux protein-like MFS transporter
LFHPLVRAATGLVPRASYVDTALLDRPVVLGSGAGALQSPTSSLAASVTGAAVAPPIERRWAMRLARHAYVRLALDARFSALWLGQLVSLLGDRLNQVALAVLVLSVTGSAIDVGITFVAATLPNLLFGPIAGTLVDRWDQKRVLVVSDLLRAGLVVLLPFAAARDIHLVYPVVFAVTTVSIFFRPARAAVLPRIVRSEDLTAANSATWTAETIADIAGYPIAGLLVAFLGSALAIAFWFDAASYIVSGVLILSVTIPPVVRSVAPAAEGVAEGLARELMEGWRFLRSQSRLFANTLISAVVQLSVGAEIALTVVYARQVLDGRFIGYPQNYASIDMAIGIGNLIGGVAIGAVGARWRKGPLIVGGYVVMGVGTALMGLTGNVLVALVAVTAVGVANMVAIIPTQTLFQELTPPELMGRVVGIRFSIVFGVMTAAMAMSGILAEAVGPGTVFVAFGVVTASAGLAGALIPAVRGS